MKRCWIGFGILGALLVLSLLATGFMTRVHEDSVLDLEQSARSALLGDWDSVQLFLRKAGNHWDKWEHLRACLMDHGPAEDIDAAFAELEVYVLAKEATAYRAACAALVCRLEALGSAHAPVWWNLL